MEGFRVLLVQLKIAFVGRDQSARAGHEFKVAEAIPGGGHKL
jgi:hypothetical protein